MKTKPVKKELSDVHCVNPDGSKSNREIMDSLLENPKKETRKDYLARRALYVREIGITPSEFDRNFA